VPETVVEPTTAFRPRPEDRARPGTVHRAAEDFIEDLPAFISHLETTAEDSWCTDVVRSPDGAANCVFGHLFQYATDHAATTELPAGTHGRTGRGGKPLHPAEVFANAVWNVFEERWTTTYMLYRVNDGENPRYDQPTPKQRVIAYLRALAAGEEDTTLVGMQKEYEAILAHEAAQAQTAG
jgi:hypothetical protein